MSRPIDENRYFMYPMDKRDRSVTFRGQGCERAFMSIGADKISLRVLSLTGTYEVTGAGALVTAGLYLRGSMLL